MEINLLLHIVIVIIFSYCVIFLGKLDILHETNIGNDDRNPGEFGHPFSMPELWGYRNHVTIEDMHVKMEHTNHLQNTEILQLFCQKVILNWLSLQIIRSRFFL